MIHQTPAKFLRSGGHRIKHFLYDFSIFIPFFIVLVLIMPCLVFEDARTQEYFFGVVGIGGGLSYFLLTHHTEEVKLFQELFTAFNKRYDRMNGRLNKIISANVQSDFSPEELNFLYDYFNLCGEEYLYYSKGFVYPEVWEAWLNGMRIFYRNERIKTLWNGELKTGSYYGLFAEILRGNELPRCCSEGGGAECKTAARSAGQIGAEQEPERPHP